MASNSHSSGHRTRPALEVVLTDVMGTEHIYWVPTEDWSGDGDKIDWAVKAARSFHAGLGLTEVPEDELTSGGELRSYAFASEPFTRDDSEFTWVTNRAPDR